MNRSMRYPYNKIGVSVCFLLWTLTCGFDPGQAEAYNEKDCIRCHVQGGEKEAGQIPRGELQASAHYVNGVGCRDCHAKALDAGHMVSGEASVDPARLKETCRRCHPAQCGTADYISWLPSLRATPHGKADFAGEYAKSDCLGCHQGKAAHGEDEPLNKRNCAICHMNRAGKGDLLGSFHPSADPTRQPSVFGAAVLYQIGLLVLLWGGFRFYSQQFSRKEKGS